MRCSVVIPCLGRADLTRACLLSLFRQTDGHALEILLVDNAKDRATQELARLDPRITVLVEPQNRGFAGACNRGIARATEPFVLVLNNDTQAAPSLLTNLHRALCGDPRIGFSAPISNRVKGDARVPVGDLGRTAEGREQIERELLGCEGIVQDVDSLSGLCLLARRETWRELSGFDERFFPGNYEDDDLSLRARLRGMRLVIARDAFLHHEAHQTFAALGIVIADEVQRQHAVFADKWQHDPAGRATLAAMRNDWGKAALAAMAAQRIHPQWPDADRILARWSQQNGDCARAASLYERFLAKCPASTDAIVQLGVSHLASGCADAARSLWRSALTSCWFPTEQGRDLLVRLGDLARKDGDVEAASFDFEAALRLSPDEPSVLNRLGAVRIEQRRFEEALPLLEAAAKAGVALAHTNLGICHFQRGDSARALEHFALAAQQLPNDPTAQANYAMARAANAR
jgi:GT2 family glycosyltransferase